MTRKQERLYKVWKNMLSRTRNLNNKNYGGKNIKVCEEWHDYEVFKTWAFEHGYDKDAKRGECTLERRDGNKNYCPENCYWADSVVQGRNRSNNHHVYVYNIKDGSCQYFSSLAEVEELYGMTSNQPKYYIKNKKIYKDTYIFSNTKLENFDDYITGKNYKKKVQCVETGEIFDSVNGAARWAGMSSSCVSYSARNNGAGTSEYHWKFVEGEHNGLHK